MLNSGTPCLTSHVERWNIASGYLRSAAFRKGSPLFESMECWPQSDWMAKPPTLLHRQTARSSAGELD